MSNLAKKKEKQCFQLFLYQARDLVFRAVFCEFFFFISFLGRFLGKTDEKFVNKQLALANWVKRVE